MPVLEKVPRKDALKAVKLIWATGLYHENIYETAGARVEGGLQTRMAELLRIFGGSIPRSSCALTIRRLSLT